MIFVWYACLYEVNVWLNCSYIIVPSWHLASNSMPLKSCQWCIQTQMSEHMTYCDSFFCAETRQWEVIERWTALCPFWPYLLFHCFLFLVRPREHHLLVSAGTRRTLCAVVVGPRLTTSRSPHVASAGTLRSARESVCIPFLVLNFSFVFSVMRGCLLLCSVSVGMSADGMKNV